MSTAPDKRTAHPFHMYDAIRDQPDAFARVVERAETAAGPCADRVARCARVFLVGLGTSLHAAQVGEHLMREYAGMPAQAVHAFDFALYGPALGPADAVIGVSHRGTKRYTAMSLARAREAGCATVLVTGEGGAPGGAEAAVTLHTVPQERSSAHTISYTGTAAALACLASLIGQRRGGRRAPPAATLVEEIPAALRRGLETEPAVASLARRSLGRRRIWLAGGGPSAITAHEIALKVKETSYLPAEAMSTETMLHGPFQCTEPEDLFVLIAPEGPAQARTAELAGLVRAIGAGLLVVGDGTGNLLQDGSAERCVVPRVPEPFTPLTCAIPLQLFAYHLALARGTNPDGFRLEDPRFARAHALVQL